MLLASSTPVSIPRPDFERMLTFSQLIYGLKHRDSYLQLLEHMLPEAAKIKPGSAGILMGFDFHLTADGPKLIEINNNAGGLCIGTEGNGSPWLAQPVIPELPGEIEQRLLSMFPTDWKTIAIVDESIQEQFMFPEMQAYAQLLEFDGRKAFLASPEDFQLQADGLYIENTRLDAIYNRHTDFYLESEAMQHIRKAYLAGQVHLNPHPRSYALLGDKARMADWWHVGLLESCLESSEIGLIRSVVPEIHLMHEYDNEQAWAERKAWVFKPSARHGGKGVLLGKAMSRKRFDALDQSDTVMQKFIPASVVNVNDKPFKFDVRLFTQGQNLIAVAGRVWQGQVTNFRTEGSGWIPLEITG
jgi:hypothetical protein